MARSMELKSMLQNVAKQESQSMKSYLREIKILADSLAAINAPVSTHDLILHTVMGLDRDYDTLTTHFSHFTGHLTFDEVRRALMNQEHIIKGRQAREQGFATHQAFMASTHTGLTKSENHSSNFTAPKNSEGSRNNNGGRGGGKDRGGRGGGKGRGRGRGGRGKGRGGGANQTQTQAQTQNSGGHSAVSCPSRYAQTSNAALAEESIMKPLGFLIPEHLLT